MTDLEWFKLLHGESSGVIFSSLIRSMLIPSEGYELFCADFAKIEVAVCWWLAENKPGLKVLLSGKDPYKYQAAYNLGKRYEDIKDDGPDRQLAKAQILGMQFGMGWKKFKETALAQYGLELSEERSKQAVANYREANWAVPELWKVYERAAIEAVEDRSTVKAGKCKFIGTKQFLWIELPSGRRLAYCDPQVTMYESEYGPRKALEFWAVPSKNKKGWWLERTWGGKITENIVQAVARDLMMPGMLRLEKAGYRALLSVHDEAICERKIGEGSVEEFCKILCETPRWADKNLPIEAKGFKASRYRK